MLTDYVIFIVISTVVITYKLAFVYFQFFSPKIDSFLTIIFLDIIY